MKTAVLSDKTLRSLALYLARNLSKDEVKVLLYNNLPEKLIKSRKKTFDTIFETFHNLIISKNIKEQNLLQQIILASLSTEYYKDQSVVNKALATYNQWLTVDDQEIFKLDSGLLLWNNLSILLPKDEDTNEILQEQKIGQEILQSSDFTIQVAEIYEAYKLLIQIIELYKEELPNIDSQMNKSYVTLANFIINTDNDIHKQINQIAKEKTGKEFEILFPHPFEHDYYIPFDDLFGAEKQMENKGIAWNEVQKELYYSFHEFGKVAQKYDVRSYTRHSHKLFLETVSRFVTDKKSKLTSESTNFKKDSAPEYALRLTLENKSLAIWVKVLDRKIEITKVRDYGKGLLLNYVIKFCNSKAKLQSFGEFIPISELDIKDTIGRGSNKELTEDIIKNKEGFGKYVNNLGLARELGNLFFGTDKKASLGFCFRTVVPLREWNTLSEVTSNVIIQQLIKKEKEREGISE